MGSGTMADRNAGVLKRSAIAWALRQGLRFAVATCVVALILATTLSGAGAERFATVAYLAAIVAALTLAGGWFFPATEVSPRDAVAQPPFPIFLGYALGVVTALSILAALVSQAGAEALVLVGAFALVVFAVLARSGRLAVFAAALGAGGLPAAASRYAVLGGVCALAFAALAGSEAGEGAVFLSYWLAVVATIAIAVMLVAPTRAGIAARQASRRIVRRVDGLARRLVFQRSATNAAIVAIASLVAGSLLPSPFSEPFAAVAYAAAAVATVSVAVECRRMRRTCESGR